jgi:sensor histidine kinase YesM
MAVFWNITEWTAALLENCIIFDFCRRFHSSKFSRLKDNVFFIGFILITSLLSIAISAFSEFSGMLTLLCMGLVIIYGIVSLNGTIFTKCFLPIVSFGLIFIINIFTNIFTSLVLGVVGSSLYTVQDGYRFFSIIVTKLLFFFATRLILILFKKGINLNQREWITISGILLISLCIGISITEISMEQNSKMSFPYFFCYSGILLVNIFVFIMIMLISTQNEKSKQISLLELQISQQKQAIEQMDILQKKIRQTNHDNLNHLYCLQELIKENHNLDEANEYLKTLINKNPEITTAHIQIPDAFLRAVLTVKMEMCRDKNIQVSLKTDDSETPCQSVDLCILLSNLLDNAIEASAKISKPEIEIILSQQKSYYTIIVRNRIENSVLKDNAELKTTKSDKEYHGMGIQSVKEIVSRYNGMMEYYEKDMWFTASIWIPQITE